MILELFRKNRAVGKMYGTPLKLLESHFLTELDAHPGVDLGFLSRILAIDQSSASRIAKRLSQSGYIALKPSSDDGRRLELLATAKGEKIIAQIDRAANERLKNFSKGLNSKEIERLRQLLSRFADGFGHPSSISRPGEHPIRLEQRRLARCFRLVDERESTAEMPTSQRMLLRLLSERWRPLAASEIADILSLQRSAISVILGEFSKKEFVISRTNPKDSRGELFSLTEAGRQALKKSEAPLLEVIESALGGLTDQECTELLKLLLRFAKLNPEREFKKRFKVLRLSSENDRRRARVFLLEQAAQMGLFDQVPELLFDKNCNALVAEADGKIVMAAQIRGKGSAQQLEAFASALRLSEYAFEETFLSQIKTNSSDPGST